MTTTLVVKVVDQIIIVKIQNYNVKLREEKSMIAVKKYDLMTVV